MHTRIAQLRPTFGADEAHRSTPDTGSTIQVLSTSKLYSQNVTSIDKNKRKLQNHPGCCMPRSQNCCFHGGEASRVIVAYVFIGREDIHQASISVKYLHSSDRQSWDTLVRSTRKEPRKVGQQRSLR